MPSPPRLRDGFQVVDLGVDSGNAPESIGKRKLAWAVNCSLRGGFPKSRPSFIQQAMTFPNQDVQTALTTGLFQGMGVFFPTQNPDGLLMISIAGHDFSIDPSNGFLVTDISIASDLNSVSREKVWSTQAEDFWIRQDGLSKPLINDGSKSFRPDPSHGIPTGTAMSYVNGRLWVTTIEGHGFVGSDLVGSSSGTSTYNFRDAVLQFTQNAFLFGGGAFSTPVNSGAITAMTSFAQIDTSLGQGPLQVYTEQGAFSCNAPADRTTWNTLTFPIQTVSMVGDGAQSQESVVTVNGDNWFRTVSGITSWQIARRDIGSWANTPMSFEMDRVLAIDDVNLLPHCSGSRFDNRLLMLAAPQRVFGRGIIWQGIVALDFSTISSLSASQFPAYDGLWTGLNVLAIVALKHRCFMWVLNSTSGFFELWEIEREEQESQFGYDNDGTTPVRIQSRIESMALNFGSGVDLIELDDGKIWVDQISGSVQFSASFKPDAYPSWVAWSIITENAKTGMCAPGLCPSPSPLVPQFHPALEFGAPPEVCDPQNQSPTRLLHLAYQFQVALDITGPFELKRLMIFGHAEKELPEPCRGTQPTDLTGVAVCENPYSYNSHH